MISSLASRRGFLKASTASVLAAAAVPHVFAAESGTLQVALVGCGGRGTGAAGQALSTSNQGPIKVVAMADIFENKLKGSMASLAKRGALFDVPQDRAFLGFDAYQKAMDCLKPGDIVILTTPCAFRWVHFTYAIAKGLNVFMEKPLTVDGPTTRRMIKLAEDADKKNLKCGVGLMVRHCKGRQALKKRLDDGEMGDILHMRAYRMGGRAAWVGRRPNDTLSDAVFQARSFHSFIWSGGGLFSDYNIHQIDECSWMKGAWPVKAHATGGRHFKGESLDQNFDNYYVEYTFPDGTRFTFNARYMDNCPGEFASYAVGSKGSCIISTASHTPGRVRLFSDYNMSPAKMTWAFPQPEPNPYQTEWDDLVSAIRNNTPYNEVKRGAEASLVTSMGRMAAHTGQIITFDQMLNSDHEYAPDVDKMTDKSPAPVPVGPDGKFAVPNPGVTTKREY